MDRKLYPGMQVSENWSSRYTFDELIERTEFVFQFDGFWDNRPILKLREPIEEMDLIQIDYDYGGIVNGSEGRFHAAFDGKHIKDLSKDVNQFVYDFLLREGAVVNDKYQPYKPTII